MHLLFDLDGTLFQARETALAAVKAVFGALRRDCPDDDWIVSNIGRPTEVFIRNVFPGDVPPDMVRDRMHRYERQAVLESGQFFLGIPETLRQLRDAGHRLFVVSNGSPEYIGLVLEATGIGEYIEGRYSAGRHDSKAAFVAELLPEEAQAVFIGDSYDDIDAGVQNRIPSIAALYGYGDKARLGEATFAAAAPEDIAAYVHQIAVFAEIRKRLLGRGGRVIGINGIDTSGKTTFTNSFARYLRAVGQKCAVIHADDFHNPLEVRRRGADEIDAYYRNAFDFDRIIKELLEPLQADGHIDREILCLNVDTDRYENLRRYTADRDTIVLIEGVLLFRPPVSDYLDGRIFLDIGFDEALRRAGARDVPKYGEAFLKKYTDKYFLVQKKYLEEFVPHLNCDILIDNSDYRKPEIR